ncbi:hypothetical protein BDW59DRAFT_176519 [Aspergillus cavernicola]|uniref:Zn(2)-C6 fungal-type domain-containing protein n=1 Tax=Aspergillus cavernicola TaxID=176166 RepID=A0ABR4HFI0_9EURO
MSSERVPCDPCRQRRVRCDGLLPCASCQRSQLACRREYARKRRGRKHGSGKVIAALRGHQSHLEQEGCDILSPENLPRVMKRCVDVYLHHLYPIMPLFKPSALTEWLDRPLELNERSMLLALCALVTTFMCGHSESIIGAVEWESVARRFIQMSLSVRSDYNFVEDSSTVTLLGSFFVAVSHVELHQARQSWFYLREAITLAHGLRLHTDEFYRGMEHMDALYCRRIYDILFVTERSFAISRHKPVLLSQPLLLPAHVPDKEHKELSAVDLGFRQLVQVYAQLDVDFLNFWSQEGSVFSGSQQEKRGFDPVLLDSGLISNTHKADILVTQHWLNLVYWRAALQQSLLSTKAEPRLKKSTTSAFPWQISPNVLQN